MSRLPLELCGILPFEQIAARSEKDPSALIRSTAAGVETFGLLFQCAPDATLVFMAMMIAMYAKPGPFRRQGAQTIRDAVL